MAGQVGLTPDEIRALDGSDGVSDGKFHGVDIADLKHDLDKSTSGWEMKDGKWYKRDYYSASKTQAQVAVTDERDQIIATLRRELAEKDAIIAELRATITAKVEIIARLEADRARYLSMIQSLEEQLRIAQTNQTVVVQQQQPTMIAVADNSRSYYRVHSQRGAALLSQYGKTDIVVDPTLPIQAAMAGCMTPVLPGPQSAVYVDQGAIMVAEPSVQTMQVQQVQRQVQVPQVQQQVIQTRQVTTTPAVSSQIATSQQEYYRVADEEARRRLDMMDGKLDGKLDGTDIRVSGGAAFGSASGGGMTSQRSYQVSMSGGAVGGGGGTSMTQQEYYRVADEEARRKLDMMDGKADGQFHGTDIQIR